MNQENNSNCHLGKPLFLSKSVLDVSGYGIALHLWLYPLKAILREENEVEMYPALLAPKEFGLHPQTT
jgi:hypothetical protein